MFKGLAKLGNIVEEANVSQFSRAGNNVAETNFAARKQENVFALGKKHFRFPDTNFASATYVSQFSQGLTGFILEKKDNAVCQLFAVWW